MFKNHLLARKVIFPGKSEIHKLLVFLRLDSRYTLSGMPVKEFLNPLLEKNQRDGK
jgi:hypothetical protein